VVGCLAIRAAHSVKNQQRKDILKWDAHQVRELFASYGLGLQDWDNIRTARGGILNWTYSKSSATVINASVSANQWLNVQETLGARKYKPSDIGFPTYLDSRCQALGGDVSVESEPGKGTTFRVELPLESPN